MKEEGVQKLSGNQLLWADDRSADKSVCVNPEL
jgi:hypothetical protein